MFVSLSVCKLLVYLALSAYLSVLTVSSRLLSAGEQQAIISVMLLPPENIMLPPTTIQCHAVTS